jgi:hypothetical protein
MRSIACHDELFFQIGGKGGAEGAADEQDAQQTDEQIDKSFSKFFKIVKEYEYEKERDRKKKILEGRLFVGGEKQRDDSPRKKKN